MNRDFNKNGEIDIGDGQYVYTYFQSNNINYIDASNSTIHDAFLISQQQANNPEPEPFVDFEVQMISSYINNENIKFVVRNIGTKDSTGNLNKDWRRILEVTDISGDDTLVVGNLKGNTPINVKENGEIKTYYPKSQTDYSLELHNSTYTSNGTTYQLSIGFHNDKSIYLTNTPPLKAYDTIEFNFKGDFKGGRHFIICADDIGYNENGDTIELIDDSDNPSNNYFIFATPPWNELGGFLLGDTTDYNRQYQDNNGFGTSIDFSDDGKIMVIGMPNAWTIAQNYGIRNSDYYYKHGAVRILEYKEYTQDDADADRYHYETRRSANYYYTTTQPKPLIYTQAELQSDGNIARDENTQQGKPIYKAPVVGQSYWTQIGNDFYGRIKSTVDNPPGENDYINYNDHAQINYEGLEFGKTVAISGDGKVVAVGSWFSTPDQETPNGHVFMYRYNEQSKKYEEMIFGRYLASTGTTRIQYTDNRILTDPWVSDYNSAWEERDYAFGTSISLSYDGNTIAIGSTSGRKWPDSLNNSWNDDNEYNSYWSLSINDENGKVTVYQLNDPQIIGGRDISAGPGNGYYQLGMVPDITNSSTSGGIYSYTGQLNGLANGEEFGYSISMTDNKRIVIGAPKYSNNKGRVFIYEWNGTSWDNLLDYQGANNFFEGNVNSYFGNSVDINKRGTRIVVGAPGYDNNKGFVRTYHYNGIMWSIISEITGTYRFGTSVALDGDGMRLITGNRHQGVHNKSNVSVYEWNGISYIGSWEQGDFNYQSLDGINYSYDFANEVAISGNGKLIGMGNSEFVEVYQNYYENTYCSVLAYEYSGPERPEAEPEPEPEPEGEPEAEPEPEPEPEGEPEPEPEPELDWVGLGGYLLGGGNNTDYWNDYSYPKYASMEVQGYNEFGKSIDLSHDGKIMVIGIPKTWGVQNTYYTKKIIDDGESGAVRILEYKEYTQADADADTYHYQTRRNTGSLTNPAHAKDDYGNIIFQPKPLIYTEVELADNGNIKNILDTSVTGGLVNEPTYKPPVVGNSYWMQIGHDLHGSMNRYGHDFRISSSYVYSEGLLFGTNVCISGDGQTIAVMSGSQFEAGGYGHTANYGGYNGVVHMYRYSVSSKKYEPMDFNPYTDPSSDSQANNDNNIFTDPYASSDSYYEESRGDTDDMFGTSISLSYDGNTIAIGSPSGTKWPDSLNNSWTNHNASYDKDDGPSGYSFNSKNGKVKVYKYNDPISVNGRLVNNSRNGYYEVGATLDTTGSSIFDHFFKYDGQLNGLENGEGFGASISMTDNLRIVIGAPNYSSKKGRVFIYDWDETSSAWVNLLDYQGANNFLMGDANNSYFGSSVDINKDGTRIVIGAPGNYNSPGLVRTYDFHGTTWSLISEITGTRNFGTSVSLNRNGTQFISGNLGYSIGYNPNRIYVPSDVSVYKWSDSDNSWEWGGFTYEGLHLDYYTKYDFARKVVTSGNGNVIAMSNIEFGYYYNNIFTSNMTAYSSVLCFGYRGPGPFNTRYYYIHGIRISTNSNTNWNKLSSVSNQKLNASFFQDSNNFTNNNPPIDTSLIPNTTQTDSGTHYEAIDLIPFLIECADDWNFIECRTTGDGKISSSNEFKKKKRVSGNLYVDSSIEYRSDLALIIKLTSYEEYDDLTNALVQLNNSNVSTNLQEYFVYMQEEED